MSDGVSASASAATDNWQKSPATIRRIRVNNNLLSTIFSPDPDQDSTKTVKRCNYHKDVNSHEDIFGQGVAADVELSSSVRCRMTPTPNTKQNIFGGSGRTPRPVSSIRLLPTAREDTFDSLFGVPEIVPNPRRPYEEDTHCKLFGRCNAARRMSQVPQENTQANLFGPPTTSVHHVTSRSEEPQLDLFGPPLPRNNSTKRVHRSSLQLFTDEVEPSKPFVTTRGTKISDASYDNIFGPPPTHPLVPRLPPEEGTAMRLFGPTIQKPLRPVEPRYNPITGEEHCETSPTTSPAPPKHTLTAVSPITGLIPGGSQVDEVEEKVSRRRRLQPVHLDLVNTITGVPLNYTDGEATQVENEEEEEEEEEEKEATEKLSSQTKEITTELRP